MSKSIIDGMSAANIEAMFEYLTEQLEVAETKEDLHAIFELARQLLDTPSAFSAVQGLDHIRAEFGPAPQPPTHGEARTAPHDPAKLSNVINLEVPHILTNTFKALSDRMKTLQEQDPDTFANATSALSWLAEGDITSTKH